jgi:hypothetical protein
VKKPFTTPTVTAARRETTMINKVFAGLRSAAVMADSSSTEVNDMSISPATSKKCKPVARIARILMLSNITLQFIGVKKYGLVRENRIVRATRADIRTIPFTLRNVCFISLRSTIFTLLYI